MRPAFFMPEENCHNGGMSITLTAPLNYFPIQNGPFEFRAGLRALKPEPASAAERIFQIDKQWSHYRAEKLAARRERLDKYLCQHQLTPAVAARATLYLINQLRREYPHCFELAQQHARTTLRCQLSGETLHFDSQLELIECEGQPSPPYAHALDALCCQMQEDLAIIEINNGADAITFLHLCLPNYWAAADKIGHSFSNAHMPVPGMEKISRQAGALLTTLMQRGPFERFTWGITTDPRLNHHPEPPPGIAADEWRGRHFDPQQPQLWLRIERQITIALPEVNSLIFTIRTYLRDTKTLNTTELQPLINAIETMPDEVSGYKGIAAQREEIMEYLRHLELQAPGLRG
jgi:hypothetical protein